MAIKKAERNRYRADGTYCWRCGDKLDEAKAVWLALGNLGRFYATEAEADSTGHNQGCFAFGSACSKRELRCGLVVA